MERTVERRTALAVGHGPRAAHDLTIVDDPSGCHDTLLGGSTRATAARGDSPPHPRHTRENFLLAAAKHGLDKRDIAPCITFFADVRTTDDGRFAWHDDPQPVDRHIDLRAEMNVLAVLSNCPHPLAPAPRAVGVVTATVARASAAGGLPERYRTAEAARALSNTAVLFCS